ncbi:MAG TPA: T9SS type A sorting domain-containing protein [Chitinophagales bacterium]|nr:T9SS type A sorting domain-containing protein [Chitinophagales bacterium]
MKRIIPLIAFLGILMDSHAQLPFTTSSLYALGAAYLDRPYIRDMADIDSDGDMDLVGYIARDGNPTVLAWLENEGTPPFVQHDIAATEYGYYIHTTDFDMDGDMDILAPIQLDGTVLYFYENHGDGDFVPHELTYLSGYYRNFAVSDLDGDLDPDILRIAPSIGGVMFDVTWLENDGDGNVTSHIIDNINTPESFGAGDLDDDGDMDFVLGTANRVYWYEKIVAGYTRHLVINSGDIFFNKIFIEDMDLDGDKDIISVSDYIIKQYENDGSENFTTSVAYDPPGGAILIGLGDINGDSFPDMFGKWVITGNYHVINLLGNADFTFTLMDSIVPICGNEALTYGDLDRDGDTDYILSENCEVGPIKDVMFWELNGSTPLPCAPVEVLNVYTDSLGLQATWSDTYADYYKLFAKCIDCPAPSPTISKTVYAPIGYLDEMLPCHTYKVKVRAFCGGSVYGSPVLTVTTDGAACRQSEVDIESVLSVYPSPASHTLMISGIQIDVRAEIYAMDLSGKTLRLENSANEIDIRMLPSGFYILTIELNGDLYRTQFIKQ